MKNIIFISLLFILTFQKVFPDCGHCFHLIKVKLAYSNGKTETGYLKFYDEYSIQNNNIRPTLNTSIIHFFPKKTDSVEIINKYYKIKNLPEFISASNKRTESLNNILDITFTDWTNITGSFNMPVLDNQSISKILNAKNIETELKVFDIHDEIYVKTNDSLGKDDFKTFLKKAYNFSDLNNSILFGLNINKRKKIYPDKNDIISRLKDYSKSLEDTIQSISKVDINKNINSYFLYYKTILEEKRRNYTSSLLEYLNTDKLNEIYSFVENQISNSHTKQIILNELSKDLSVVEKTINLCSMYYSTKDDNLLMDLFYQTLKQEDIIIIVNSWD